MQEIVQSSVSMTSREIAELTGKRHADVLRDIDRLIKSLNADLRLGFKSNSYTDETGRANRMFDMDRDSSFCLVAGYDANARMRIIKRWQELESGILQKSRYTDSLTAKVERAVRLRQRRDEITAGLLAYREAEFARWDAAMQEYERQALEPLKQEYDGLMAIVAPPFYQDPGLGISNMPSIVPPCLLR